MQASVLAQDNVTLQGEVAQLRTDVRLLLAARSVLVSRTMRCVSALSYCVVA